MPDNVSTFALPVAALAVLWLVLRIIASSRGALTGACVFYLIFGVFTAAAQFSSIGGCESWRDGNFLWPMLAWPADFYQNVIHGDISPRRYFLPRSCEGAPQAPAPVPAAG